MMRKKKSGIPYHRACNVTFFAACQSCYSPDQSPICHVVSSLQGTASRLQLTIYYTVNFYYHPSTTVHLFIQRSKATRVIKNKNFYSAHVHVFWGSRLTLYVSSPIIGDIRCETLHFKAKNKRGFLKLWIKWTDCFVKHVTVWSARNPNMLRIWLNTI